MHQIKVMGPGCKRCAATAELIQSTARQLGQEVKLEKVTDYAEIASAGVVSTPAVMVDGKVVHAGGVPKEADIRTWLGG